MKKLLIFLCGLMVATIQIQAQQTTDSIAGQQAKKYQAKPPKTKPFGARAFGRSKKTTLRWLGMAGFFINSRGTTLMIDPLLKGFDMPLLIDFPINTEKVPHLDAILVTH